MQYFGSSIVEGVAEIWVEAEMSWVEVDGAGWWWVHGLVIPIMVQDRSVISWKSDNPVSITQEFWKLCISY